MPTPSLCPQRLRSHALPIALFGEPYDGPYLRLVEFDRAVAATGDSEFKTKGVGGLFTEEVRVNWARLASHGLAGYLSRFA